MKSENKLYIVGIQLLLLSVVYVIGSNTIGTSYNPYLFILSMIQSFILGVCLLYCLLDTFN